MVVFLVYVAVCMKYVMDGQAMNKSATPCEANLLLFRPVVLYLDHHDGKYS